MNFKEYDNFINNHQQDMLFFIIYYNIKCNIDLSIECGKAQEEIEKIIYFIHDAYLKDESGLDLAKIYDVAIDNKEKILYNNIDKWELLRLCYE